MISREGKTLTQVHTYISTIYFAILLFFVFILGIFVVIFVFISFMDSIIDLAVLKLTM